MTLESQQDILSWHTTILALPSNMLPFRFNNILQAIINGSALIFFTTGLLHHLFNSSSNVFPPQNGPLMSILDSVSF
jgi:hypothetical protein